MHENPGCRNATVHGSLLPLQATQGLKWTSEAIKPGEEAAKACAKDGQWPGTPFRGRCYLASFASEPAAKDMPRYAQALVEAIGEPYFYNFQ